MNLRSIERKITIRNEKYDLSGKSVLLTGRIPKYTRTVIEQKITQLGGIIYSTRYDADIVVFTKNDSTKFIRAKHASIYKKTMLFISGEEFVKNYLKFEG